MQEDRMWYKDRVGVANIYKTFIVRQISLAR